MAIFTYKISFHLNGRLQAKDPKKLYSLYFRYRQGRNVDFCATTGIKMYLNDWNEQTQKLRQKAHIKNRYEKNALLTGLVDYFDKKVIEFAQAQKTPTYTEIKALFNEYINPQPKSKKLDLFTFIGLFIERAKIQPNQTTKKIVSKTTLKGYNATKNILLAFNSEIYKLDFEDITIKFYYDFIAFCENRNLSYNYIGKHIKILKTFMLSALNDGLHSCTDFQLKEFAKLKEESDNIYLNEKELKDIWLLDLSKKPHLDKAKDLFLIGAYTGLRFSDWHKVNAKNIKTINDIQMLVIPTQKTGIKVSIPVHSIVNAILNKYNGTLPKLSAQKINTHIKEVGKRAQINTIVSKKQPTKRGLRAQIQTPKHDLIKTHTARRSFCTNAYLQDMNTLDIMAISGHKTEVDFLNYIKVSSEHRAVKIAKHSFFNNSNNLKIAK